MKTIREAADVLLLSTTSLSFVTLSDVETAMKIIVLALTALYTADKFIYNMRNRGKNGEEK